MTSWFLTHPVAAPLAAVAVLAALILTVHLIDQHHHRRDHP